MVAGLTLFFALNAAAFVAGLAVAYRARGEGRAESALTMWLVWHAIVSASIYALGWTSLLTRPALALMILAVSGAIVGAALYVPEPARAKERLGEAIAFAEEIAALPYEALAETARAGSFALVALLYAYGVIAYTAWLSWLTPSIGWDAVWYHEAITGYTIQNHGFRTVDVPISLEYVNGFPRLCEMMNLWFAYFTDRRMNELPNTVMCVPLMLSIFTFTRRHGADRSLAIVWACAFMLLPALQLQLRCTYIDTHLTALFMMTAAYVFRPRLRMRDAWLAAIGLGLLLGAKGHALIYVPIFGVVTAARLLWQGRDRLREALATIAGGVSVIALLGGGTWLRNWTLHHNPLWPIAYTSERFGVDWKGGGVPIIHDTVLDLNPSVKQFFDNLYAVPKPGLDFPDMKEHGYGLGLGFVLLPICAFALPLAIYWLARRRDRVTWNMLQIVFTFSLMAKFSPGLQMARYNMHIPAAAVLVVNWVASVRFRRLAEGAAAAVFAFDVAQLYWADPAWSVTWEQAKQLAQMSAPDRAAWKAIYWAPAPETARARDRELGPGDVTVYLDDKFAGFLWNERYSNTVEYLPHGAPLLPSLDRMNAKWVVVYPGFEYNELKQSSGWQEVGLIASNEPNWIAFRRAR